MSTEDMREYGEDLVDSSPFSPTDWSIRSPTIGLNVHSPSSSRSPPLPASLLAPTTAIMPSEATQNETTNNGQTNYNMSHSVAVHSLHPDVDFAASSTCIKRVDNDTHRFPSSPLLTTQNAPATNNTPNATSTSITIPHSNFSLGYPPSSRVVNRKRFTSSLESTPSLSFRPAPTTSSNAHTQHLAALHSLKRSQPTIKEGDSTPKSTSSSPSQATRQSIPGSLLNSQRSKSHTHGGGAGLSPKSGTNTTAGSNSDILSSGTSYDACCYRSGRSLPIRCGAWLIQLFFLSAFVVASWYYWQYLQAQMDYHANQQFQQSCMAHASKFALQLQNVQDAQQAIASSLGAAVTSQPTFTAQAQQVQSFINTMLPKSAILLPHFATLTYFTRVASSDKAAFETANGGIMQWNENQGQFVPASSATQYFPAVFRLEEEYNGTLRNTFRVDSQQDMRNGFQLPMYVDLASLPGMSALMDTAIAKQDFIMTPPVFSWNYSHPTMRVDRDDLSGIMSGSALAQGYRHSLLQAIPQPSQSASYDLTDVAGFTLSTHDLSVVYQQLFKLPQRELLDSPQQVLTNPLRVTQGSAAITLQGWASNGTIHRTVLLRDWSLDTITPPTAALGGQDDFTGYKYYDRYSLSSMASINVNAYDLQFECYTQSGSDSQLPLLNKLRLVATIIPIAMAACILLLLYFLGNWYHQVQNEREQKYGSYAALKEAVQQLSREKDRKTEFLDFLCHELRNPLHAVIGMADTLLETQLTMEQSDAVYTIHSSSELMRAITDDVLDLATMDSGEIQLAVVDMDLHALMHSIVRGATPFAEERGISIITTIQDRVPTYIQSDVSRLNQIIANLLSNAIKFSNKHRHIDLRVEVVDDDSAPTSTPNTGSPDMRFKVITASVKEEAEDASSAEPASAETTSPVPAASDGSLKSYMRRLRLALPNTIQTTPQMSFDPNLSSVPDMSVFGLKRGMIDTPLMRSEAPSPVIGLEPRKNGESSPRPAAAERRLSHSYADPDLNRATPVSPFARVKRLATNQIPAGKCVKLRFTVTDQGCGIPNEHLPFLFDAYTSEKRSITTEHNLGVGLGLAIVKKLCDAMKAQIHISSTVNVGTCVSFEIEVVAAEVPSEVTRVIMQKLPQQGTVNESTRYKTFYNMVCRSHSDTYEEKNGKDGSILRNGSYHTHEADGDMRMPVVELDKESSVSHLPRSQLQLNQQRQLNETKERSPEPTRNMSLAPPSSLQHSPPLPALHSSSYAHLQIQSAQSSQPSQPLADPEPIPFTLAPLHPIITEESENDSSQRSHPNLHLNPLASPLSTAGGPFQVSPSSPYDGSGCEQWTSPGTTHHQISHESVKLMTSPGSTTSTINQLDTPTSAGTGFVSTDASIDTNSVDWALLQRMNQECKSPDIANSEAALSRTASFPCVLVVDDAEVNRKILRKMLQSWYRIEEAVNGKVALDLVTENPNKYVAVLMDLVMPVMSGRECTTTIRDAGLTQLPIIACTANSTKDDISECLANGFTAFLSKPYRKEQVRGKIEECRIQRNVSSTT